MCATACLLMRMGFFIHKLIEEDQDQWTEIDLSITVIGSAFSTSMTASQLLTYILLIIRLNHYFMERDHPDQAQIDKPKVMRQETFAKIFLTFFVIALPTVITVEVVLEIDDVYQ